MTTTVQPSVHPAGPSTASHDGTDTPPEPRRGFLATTVRLTMLQLRLMLREPGVLVGIVGFPAVTVLVLAGVFGSVPDPEFGGVAPSEHYVVGYAAIVLASLGLVALPTHVAANRELGVLRRFRAAGIGAGPQVASHFAVGAVLGTVSALIVLAVGGLAYGLPSPEEPLLALAWFGAGLVCFVAIGGALGSLLRGSRSAVAVGNMLLIPAFLLGGGGPPRQVMTGPMQRISDVIPLSHIVGGLRQSWLGSTDDPHAIWWPVLVAVVALGVAVWSTRRAVD